MHDRLDVGILKAYITPYPRAIYAILYLVDVNRLEHIYVIKDLLN